MRRLRPTRQRGINLMGLVLGALLQAPALSQQKDEVFPAETVFRELQLSTLSCSRDNSSRSCDPARRQADPLLDHPLLPAGCKDVLWEITQKAVPAVNPSLTRRDGLDQLATQVTIVCKPGAPMPPRKSRTAS